MNSESMMEAEKVCRCPTLEPRGVCNMYALGYSTEYKENYDWGNFIKHRQIMDSLRTCPDDNEESSTTMKYDGRRNCCSNYCSSDGQSYEAPSNGDQAIDVSATSEHPVFISSRYKSIFRSSRLLKDEQGEYVDPFRDLRTTSSGRRFICDQTHPEMIVASQFSPELVDVPNAYSFSCFNRLVPEVPWDKTIQWKAESEKGCWPTKLWKKWTKAASSPPFDGFDNQCKYSPYKVSVSSRSKGDG